MKEINCNNAGEIKGQEGKGSYGDYEGWYEKHIATLENQYIKDHPEEFPTDDSMSDIDKNNGFQQYVEIQWEIYNPRGEKNERI